MLSAIELNKLSKEIHTYNVSAGWWGDDPSKRCIKTVFQLISTEICEATEGERKDLMDDKLPHRKMGEVELADALIRTLDFGGYMGLELTDDIHPWGTQEWRQHPAAWHWDLTESLVDLYSAYRANLTGWYDLGLFSDIDGYYEEFIFLLLNCAHSLGYDIQSAMYEKMKFNEDRADHKPENRNKPGGKAF